jgi:PKD repeat protein
MCPEPPDPGQATSLAREAASQGAAQTEATMNTLAKALLTTAALGALILAVPGSAVSQSQPTTTPTLKFGMEASSVAMQSAAGVKPDYGTFWIGPWTLGSGWGGPDARLSEMKASGVTPAIHFYYWGDDISPSCVENGCWSSLHSAQKDRAGWEKLGTQLTDHLNAKLGGAPALIFLESEFNKGGIETYEPFDGYMAAMANKIRAAYPNAIVVLGFGNWGSAHWGNYDRAAAASDMVGIQGMRGSTKQSVDGMKNLYEGLTAGVKTLNAKFPGKAVILTDIAVSSYPEPGYLAVQRDVIKEVLDNRAALKALGVQAIIYRSWKDSPNMDTANYYGQAERHWGVAWAGNVTLKESGKVWVAAVKAERAGSSGPGTTATTTTTAAANRAPSAAFSSSVSGLTGSFDGSASSDPEGRTLTYAWTFGDGASATGRTVSHAYGAPGTYTATLKVSDGSLTATASKAVSVVQANRAPTAAFAATARELAVSVDGSGSSDPDGNVLGYSWSFGDGTSASGRTASKVYAAAGTYPVRLTVSDGALTSVATKSVTVAKATSSSSSATSAPATTSGSGYSASFTFGSGANEWWMETKVSSSSAPVKVEVKVGSGSWTPLRKRDATTWGEEMHVTKGTPVAFRATASDGRTATTGQHAYLGGTAPMAATGTSTATATTAAPAPATTTSAPAATTSAAATTFKAYFSARSVGNDWWVEAAAQGNEPLSKVEAKVNGGSWVTLPKQSWGAYAASIHAPNGSQVTFRATGATSGGLSYSQPVTWT